ncbi:DNA-binding protein [Duganella sp. HH101]|uniref:DNA-binding protein n=1 Tax=Duganella sp. HH101 TaxID=1781066 RepID=UPI0008FCC1C1|nr:DNA-binding protein [Duganella sp. HH101]
MPLTADQVISEFSQRGISIADWSRKNGFKPSLVYQVLRARTVPERGKSHAIAVALGLKDGRVTPDYSWIPSNQFPADKKKEAP